MATYIREMNCSEGNSLCARHGSSVMTASPSLACTACMIVLHYHPPAGTPCQHVLPCPHQGEPLQGWSALCCQDHHYLQHTHTHTHKEERIKAKPSDVIVDNTSQNCGIQNKHRMHVANKQAGISCCCKWYDLCKPTCKVWTAHSTYNSYQTC